MERYQFNSDQMGQFEEKLRERLQFLNEYAYRAMAVKASTPIGRLFALMGRLFSKASEGPAHYRPPGQERWERPQIVAGSGCIVLGLALLLGLVYLGVLAFEYPVAGISGGAVVVFMGIYHVIVRSRQRREMASLRNEVFPAVNGAESERLASALSSFESGSGHEPGGILRENAVARIFATFTVSVVDYRKKYHYIAGESMWLFDGNDFSAVYTFVSPADEYRKGDVLREYVQPLFDEFQLKDAMGRIEKIRPLPFDAHEFHLSWYLPQM